MATDLNRVILVGWLTQDAELAYTTTGVAISKFSLAVNRSRKDSSGQWVNEVSFFEIRVIGKLGENLKNYLLKGKQIGLVGFLKQERWKDQQGQNRNKIIITAEEIELLGGKKEENDGYNNSSYDNGYDGGYNDGYNYS